MLITYTLLLIIVSYEHAKLKHAEMMSDGNGDRDGDGLRDGESQSSYREHTLEEGHTAQASYDEGK